MTVRKEITHTFNCSLERAFKAPILGDATKFLNGYFIQPPIVAFEDDENWGKPDGIRFPLTSGNIFVPKGRLLLDKILERDENKYWKWTIYNFVPKSMFFTSKAVGEWFVSDNKNGTVGVKYVYTYYSRNWFTHPMTWLFVHIQVSGLMNKAIIGIREQAESENAFIYHN